MVYHQACSNVKGVLLGCHVQWCRLGFAARLRWVRAVLDEAGGIVQPFAFDPDKFEVYAKL